MCGAEIRQRFGSPPPPPRRGSPPPSASSWRGAEETIIMPIVPAAEAGAPRRKPTKQQPPRSAVSEPPTSAPVEEGWSEAEVKPFFTEVAPAVTNRQHRRLRFIVPVLLLVFLLLLGFALFVLPYI